MVDSDDGGDLKRGGKEGAPEKPGSVGWYIPPMQCITWSGILWFNVNVVILCFRVVTLPLVLLVHSPAILEPLYRPVPREPAVPWPEPGTVGWYLPRCIMWFVLAWFNVNAFIRLDLWIALLGFLVHTVPLVLLVHFPDILDHLDRSVARQPLLRPAAQNGEHGDENDYVIVQRQ